MPKPLSAKTITVALATILLLLNIGSKAQMRQIHLENTEAAEISKFSFYSPAEGYVAFRDWIGFSIDSGKTFTNKHITTSNVDFNGYGGVNLTFGFEIKGVKAFNQNEVIAYGSYGLVPAILRSINGGNNFTLVFYSQYNPQQLRTGITDLVFPENNDIGYAIDADRILKSTNRGLSWTIIRTSPGSYFSNLEAVDNNVLVALSIGANNSFLKTADAGVNWTYRGGTIIPGGSMTYAYFLTNSIGWLSLHAQDNRQHFYKTTNGGSSWQLQNDIDVTGFNTYKFRFVDQNIGYALAGQNEVYRTSDGGKVWEPLARDNQYSYLGYTHNDFQFYSPAQLWAGGGNGLIELNTNIAGSVIPQAFYKVQHVYNTTTVNLVNFSKTGYTYKWLVNGTTIGSSYHISYIHDIYVNSDTIQLVVSNGLYTDTTTHIQLFENIPFPAPVVTSFTPAIAEPGTTVTINGSFFKDVLAVKFGGVPAASFNAVSHNVITAVVANGANGDVSVTSPTGTGSLGGFMSTPPPLVQSFTPNAGPVGTTITISGANFSAVPSENMVTIGGIRATINSASSTQLSAVVPAGGSHQPITVTVNGHTGYAISPFTVTFPAACGFTGYTFAKPVVVENVYESRAFVSADLNNDGKPDIVSAAGYGIIVFKNTSTADKSNFEALPLIPGATGNSTPMTVCVADFNGDGRPDIVYTDYVYNKISLLKNISNGGNISFSPRVDIDAGDKPTQIVTADLDKDGKPDIAYLNKVTNNNKLTILRNNSQGGNISFEVKQQFAIINPISLKTGDIDADGLTDLVTSNIPSNINGDITKGVSVYRNTSLIGAITMAPRVEISTTNIGPEDIEVADIDGDGKQDIIISDDLSYAYDQTHAILVYRNTGSGSNISFVEHKVPVCIFIRDIALDDLDGDGRLDIYAYCFSSSTNILLKNRSTPGIIDIGYIAGFASGVFNEVLLTDVNSDGKPDLVSDGGVLTVRLNTLGTKGAFAGKDTTACIGQQIVLGSAATAGSGNPPGFQFSWSANPQGFTSTLANPVIITSVSTQYFVAVTNPQGCTMHDTVMVTVAGPPPGGTPIPTELYRCSGDTLRIINEPIAGYSYFWFSEPVGFSSTISNPDIIVKGGLTKYMLVTSNGSCNSVQTLRVNGNNKPVAKAGADRNLCYAAGTTIGNATSSNYDTYSWTSSDPGFTATGKTVYVTPLATTNYYLKQTNIAGCSGRDTVVVTIITGPPANAGPDKLMCGNETVAIGSPAVNGLTYFWRDENMAFLSNNAVLYVNPMVTTTYYLSVSNGICAGRDTVTVNVFPGIPTIAISATDTSFCPANIGPVLFTASSDAGSSFVYEWRRNGIVTLSNSTSYQLSNPQHGDTIWATISGNIGCTGPTVVHSNKLIVRIENRWIGQQGAYWELPSNWSCGSIPDGNSNVLIPENSYVRVISNATCRSIRLLTGAFLDISPGVTFTVMH